MAPTRLLGVPEPVTVRVPAKVNLHLSVGPTRKDGYHVLVTVFHAISLYDQVTAMPARDLSIGIGGEGADELSPTEDNLAWKAAVLLAERAGVQPAVRLDLVKGIPVAGGLAGGSADAAATLVACDALWGTGRSRDDLAAIAAELGSDVPFLVLGGTALGLGRGELVSPVLAPGRAWHWVLALAEGGLSTPQVYRELDRLRAAGAAPAPASGTDQILAALRQRDAAVLAASLVNDLQPAALVLRPSLQDTLDAGVAAGSLAGIVSGSGPTCAFLCRDAASADTVAKALEESGTCRAVRQATGPVPGARLI